MPIVCALTPAS